jgi:hypothetical protein
MQRQHLFSWNWKNSPIFLNKTEILFADHQKRYLTEIHNLIPLTMRNTISILILALTFVVQGCNSNNTDSTTNHSSTASNPADSTLNQTASTETTDSGADKVEALAEDTIPQTPKRTQSAGPTADWKTEQFIISCPEELRQDLIADLEYYRGEWKDVPKTFVARYRGSEFGDYFHLNFEDTAGKSFDFGFGENDFGEIELYFDDEQLSDNPKYLNKAFNLHWEWKIASFPCCSGGYEQVEAYRPSIAKLELLKDTGR